MNKQQVATLGEMPLSRLIPRLALPTVVSMVITGVYNMADAYFAARLSTAAAGGVGIVFSVFSLLQAAGYTVALGGSTLISRLLGEDNEKEAARVSAATFWMACAVGLLLGGAGFALTPGLVSLLGATKTVFPHAVAYLRPVMLSAPFLCGGFALSCMLRAIGRANAAMLGIGTGSLVNVLLDPLLMRVCSPGIGGIGYATLMGQAACFVLLLIAFLRKPACLCLTPNKAAWQAGLFLQILRQGISSLFRQGMAAVSTVLLNRKAAGFGDSALAAITLAGKATGILYAAFLGWGQGYQPVAGYCHGKGDPVRIRKAFFFTLGVGTACLTIFAAALFVFAQPVLTFLGAGRREIAQTGIAALRAQAVFMPLIPLGVLVNMTYQSLEHPLAATLLACCRQGFCLIPLLLWFPGQWGLQGLLFAQGAADGITFLISLPMLLLLFKKIRPGR